MFRYERPQAGRQRQFHQIGVEFIGLDSVISDAEVISIAWDFLNDIGLKFDYFFNREGNNQIKKNLVYFLLDYSSNNDVTNNTFNFGIGYERFLNQIGSINFNMGVKKIQSFEGLSYGLEYKDKTTNLCISLANVVTAWNDDYIVLSFKYAYNK